MSSDAVVNLVLLASMGGLPVIVVLLIASIVARAMVLVQEA
jgi:hypothetical protein